jgi:hypothetical protein
MILGCRLACSAKALLKKRLAAAASRLAVSRKSMVCPLESTARYRYRSRPFTFIYVSSTDKTCWWASDESDSVCRVPARTPAPSATLRRNAKITTLRHDSGYLPITERESQASAHGQQDDLAFIMSPEEWVARPDGHRSSPYRDLNWMFSQHDPCHLVEICAPSCSRQTLLENRLAHVHHGYHNFDPRARLGLSNL